VSSNERAIVATGDVLYSGQHNVLSGGAGVGSWWARFGNANPGGAAQFSLGNSRDVGTSEDFPEIVVGQTYQIEVLEGAADAVPGAIYQRTLPLYGVTLSVAAGEIVAASTTLSVDTYDAGGFGPNAPAGALPILVIEGAVPTPVPSQVTVVILPAA
jgi:hypothetical protein